MAVGRRSTLITILATVVAALVGLALTPAAPAATTAEISGQTHLLREVNTARTARGLAPLRLSRVLSRPARQHSAYLARTGELDHDGADGRPFYVRLYRAGFPRTKAVGENLGIIGGCSTDEARMMVEMWLDSPSHRANLLSRRYRVVGIGVVAAGDCSNTVYATDFGG